VLDVGGVRTIQHTIPDDLGRKLEHLAAGMNRDVDSLVRKAIQTWVELVEEEKPEAGVSSRRLPDLPLEDAAISPPVELPRNEAQRVQTRRTTERIADPLE
jgi:hypothetical protein